jgi:hypothetical protein
MQEPNMGQEWSVYSDDEKRWRPVRIVNVLGEEVEVQYLDMTGVPDLARTQTFSRSRMLSQPKTFRLDKGVP